MYFILFQKQKDKIFASFAIALDSRSIAAEVAMQQTAAKCSDILSINASRIIPFLLIS